MASSRNDCLECVRKNIRLIRRHMKQLSAYEISSLYNELKDVLFFYGFDKKDVVQLIEYSGNYDEYSDEELLEVEGVTNAILFHLKYKM